MNQVFLLAKRNQVVWCQNPNQSLTPKINYWNKRAFLSIRSPVSWRTSPGYKHSTTSSVRFFNICFLTEETLCWKALASCQTASGQLSYRKPSMLTPAHSHTLCPGVTSSSFYGYMYLFLLNVLILRPNQTFFLSTKEIFSDMCLLIDWSKVALLFQNNSTLSAVLHVKTQLKAPHKSSKITFANLIRGHRLFFAGLGEICGAAAHLV